MHPIVDHEYHGVVVGSMTKDTFDWLESRLGKNEGRWFIKSSLGESTIYFRDQRDHTLFLITWGKN